MTNTNITQARSELFNLVKQVLESNDVVNISTKNGDVVMLSADEYNDIMETLYLQSIPGMQESIVEGLNTPLENTKEIDWRKALK